MENNGNAMVLNSWISSKSHQCSTTATRGKTQRRTIEMSYESVYKAYSISAVTALNAVEVILNAASIASREELQNL